jgi:hypothetical protein
MLFLFILVLLMFRCVTFYSYSFISFVSLSSYLLFFHELFFSFTCVITVFLESSVYVTFPRVCILICRLMLSINVLYAISSPIRSTWPTHHNHFLLTTVTMLDEHASPNSLLCNFLFRHLRHLPKQWMGGWGRNSSPPALDMALWEMQLLTAHGRTKAAFPFFLVSPGTVKETLPRRSGAHWRQMELLDLMYRAVRLACGTLDTPLSCINHRTSEKRI